MTLKFNSKVINASGTDYKPQFKQLFEIIQTKTDFVLDLLPGKKMFFLLLKLLFLTSPYPTVVQLL